MTIVEATRTVVGGIDTHGEVHVAIPLTVGETGSPLPPAPRATRS